jgi:hypothetical protein
MPLCLFPNTKLTKNPFQYFIIPHLAQVRNTLFSAAGLNKYKVF